MEAKTPVEKTVNYKVRCIDDAEWDTTIGKVYECYAELYDPDTNKLILIAIVDDVNDEHAVSPDYFKKVA